MNNYLVKLTLNIVGYEKQSHLVVSAPDESSAKEQALRDECHNEPNFDEWPDMNACWDGDDFIYEVYSCRELTDEQYETLKDVGIAY
jgi:hypothetical protein